jgi:hypothetical protein
VSLRCDQLIPVSKAVNKKDQAGKWLEQEEKKNSLTRFFPFLRRSRSDCLCSSVKQYLSNS